jgi:hypothetical protein
MVFETVVRASSATLRLKAEEAQCYAPWEQDLAEEGVVTEQSVAHR